MNETEVLIVRVYLHEAKSQMEELLKYLHDEQKVRGVTVFRGITGFGTSGEYHSSKLIDMSLDLPIVVEFFDEEEKVKTIIEELNKKIKPGHIVSWPANINM
ncbi:MAG: PII-like signaling protein [Gammaproteobacteria bacterium]|jgi:PII-like signaling protein